MSKQPSQLAVLGWSDRIEQLLPLLEARAGMRLAGVGDRRTASLIRARRATNAPCFQHTAEMVRRLDYDALLIGGAEPAVELAATAAGRGADLLAEGDALSAEALDAVPPAAVRHGVALALVRPPLRSSGVEALSELLASDPEWRPSLVTMELSGPRSAAALLRDGVALSTRLLGTAPAHVSAALAGGEDYIAAQLRYANGGLIALSARQAAAPGLRVETAAPAGETRLSAVATGALFELRPAGGTPRGESHGGGDDLALEVEHILAALAGDGRDLQLAHREAAILAALESAIRTGQTHHVAESGVRSTLRLLDGGAHSPSAPAGDLHLVSRQAG